MKDKINYKMKLDVLTPVHIADVDYKSKVKKNEYMLDFRTKSLTIIDTNKFVDFLINKNLYEKYLDFIQSNVERFNLYTFLDKENILSHIDKFKKATYNNVRYSKMNELMMCIRNSYGQPYIPGSSIKGALMNSLLVDFIVKNRKVYQNEINEISRMKNLPYREYKNHVKRIVSEIENDILYGNGGSSQKGHGISISDTYKAEDLNTNIYQDIDQNMEGKRQGYNRMPNYREYLTQKTRMYFDINLDYEKINRGRLDISSMDDLLSSLKNATNYLIENTLKQNQSSSLILGGNTGYHQKTIVHSLFPDDRERVEVVRLLINNSTHNKSKGAAIRYHLNDKNFSPRVINRVEHKNELAGMVNITREV